MKTYDIKHDIGAIAGWYILIIVLVLFGMKEHDLRKQYEATIEAKKVAVTLDKQLESHEEVMKELDDYNIELEKKLKKLEYLEPIQKELDRTWGTNKK